MKNKIIATLVAFGMVGSASALEINENLSINGFIDTSYTHTETDASGGDDNQNLGLDEIELNFLFNVGGASGAIHIDDYDGAENGNAGTAGPVAGATTDSGIDIEQAFIGYSLENGVSFTLGRYGSLLGFEREDPAGLATYSRAYSTNNFNLGNVDANVAEGLRVGYNSEVFGISASLQNENADADIDGDHLDLEVAFSYTGIENLTIGGGYHFDNQADSNDETDVLNLHVSTAMGKFLFGGEYIEIDSSDSGGDDLDGWMIIADYDVSEKLGVALRISSNEIDGQDSDYEKVTIAPNYSLSESLGLILEYSDIENAGDDSNQLALELTFTF
jgi:hypothetical protein